MKTTTENDKFLTMCKSINPSAEVDKAKNLEAIQLKLKEQNTMKTKRVRRPLPWPQFLRQ